MKRYLARTLPVLALAVALSACSMFAAPNANRLLFGLTPVNELGYEVSTSGEITIATRTLVLSTRAGGPVTTVTGYHIEYYNASGSLVGATYDDPRSLNVTLPAGFLCDEPDPVVGCNSLSEGARPGPGIPVELPAGTVQLLNVDIAQQHIAAGYPTGWYAAVTLFYDNAFGAFSQTYNVAIVAPN